MPLMGSLVYRAQLKKDAELEDISIESQKTKKQRECSLKQKQNRISKDYGTMTNVAPT